MSKIKPADPANPPGPEDPPQDHAAAGVADPAPPVVRAIPIHPEPRVGPKDAGNVFLASGKIVNADGHVLKHLAFDDDGAITEKATIDARRPGGAS